MILLAEFLNNRDSSSCFDEDQVAPGETPPDLVVVRDTRHDVDEDEKTMNLMNMVRLFGLVLIGWTFLALGVGVCRSKRRPAEETHFFLPEPALHEAVGVSRRPAHLRRRVSPGRSIDGKRAAPAAAPGCDLGLRDGLALARSGRQPGSRRAMEPARRPRRPIVLRPGVIPGF